MTEEKPTKEDLQILQILKTNFVRSSNLVRADYDPLLESLTIYFKSGAIYEYCGVKKEVFDEMKEIELNEGSVGRYFHQHIRDAYEHMKKA